MTKEFIYKVCDMINDPGVPISRVVIELQPYLIWCIKSYSRSHLYDDIKSEMQIELMAAIERIRERAVGPADKAYSRLEEIKWRVQNACKRILANDKIARERLKKYVAVENDQPSAIDGLIKQDQIRLLYSMIGECQFSDREMLILNKRVEGLLDREIGQLLGLSTNRVHVLRNEIWQKIKSKLPQNGMMSQRI